MQAPSRSTSNASCVLLIPYYGDWPDYMPLYLMSCAALQGVVDVLFLTNNENLPGPDVPNVRLRHVGYRSLLSTIEEKLRCGDLSHVRPYKLCDFRPAYGEIFADEISGYDYWGYGDIDLVYGNLGEVLQSVLKRSPDVVAFRENHLHGPFTLYRNSDRINQLYNCSHFHEVVKDPVYRSFDEFGDSMMHLQIEQGVDLMSLPPDNISTIVFQKVQDGSIKAELKSLSRERIEWNEVLRWDNGHVSDDKLGKEYVFYHWVIEKRATWFKYPNSYPKGKYYFAQTGVYSETEYLGFRWRHFTRRAWGATRWYQLRFFNFVKRRLGAEVRVDTYRRFGHVKFLG